MNEETVGFAETDPTVQQYEDVVAIPQVSNHLVQQISVGFSETDPANRQLQESVTVLSGSNSPAQRVFVGFSETDPTTNLYRPVGELSSQYPVDCHDENTKDSTQNTPKFSRLAEIANRHEQG